MGFTNYHFLHIPYNLFVKARRRRLFLLSIDNNLVLTVFLHLITLKIKIPYKLRGFFFPRQLILMKPGKKRF